jgi:hypothetical protein
MSERLRELLLKAVHQLDPAEQEEVLGELLTGGAAPWLGTPEHELTRRLTWPTGHNRAEVAERISAMVAETGDLKMLPVRLPAADYERLRAWSREHGFSMAVIIRTLVERFLDDRAARA